MKDIIITVEGGAVQNVEGVPEGVRVIIKDYDIDGIEEEILQLDPDQDWYQEAIYEN